MKNKLIRKNIESFLTDILVIGGLYFIHDLRINSLVFLAVMFFTYLILVITKQPPKKMFPAVIYTFSVLFPVLGFVMYGKFLPLSSGNLSGQFDLVSLIILLFTFLTFILALIGFVKNKIKENLLHNISQTYLRPVLMAILVLSVSFMATSNNNSIIMVLLIYLPLRFLMAYKVPVKWYQFILLIISVYFAFTSVYGNANKSPISAISLNLRADISYTEVGSYHEDTVVAVNIANAYDFNDPEGTFYFVIYQFEDSLWRLDKSQTIQLSRDSGNYWQDSTSLVRLFSNINFNQQHVLKESCDDDIYNFQNKASKSERYCDTARTKLKYHKPDTSLIFLQHAEDLCPMNSDIYYLRGLAFLDLNQPDSACLNFHKAVLYYNLDAVSYYRNSCKEN